MKLPEELTVRYDGKCDPKCIVQGDKYRFSVLTEELVRMEYSPHGLFCDKPTQVVVNRRFPVPSFTVKESEERLEITTRAFHLVYDKKEFSPQGLQIDLKASFTGYGGHWDYGTTTFSYPPVDLNLKGTARTLDQSEGEVELERGLVDFGGRAFFDDSRSLTLTEEGWPEERAEGIHDCYYFGYGHDYYKAVHDFYLLSGAIPLLPRYALGNWWSRYYKYTAESYAELFRRFGEEEKVPFSVAVLDMDWHLVDIPPENGSGWTGYTWNRELFPHPEKLLEYLHERDLHVILNLHPADGVRSHEDAYEAMCKALGKDPSSGEPILFDCTSREFLAAYFKYLHHPLEEEGVDAWWLDWQQGGSCSLKGLDPLRVLNHFHFLDLERGKEKRGLILSRYGGLGSHRYPVGFSGDTIMSWASLAFQPYFTATASNVGYCWWSHDIGGHMLGYRDNELMVRWLQLGVFSPINRIHSSQNEFFNKEPWSYREPYRAIMDRFLRLRHQLLPYIYTMNWRVHHDLIPFIVPMYYDYPECEKAYEVKNQYMFGSQLMVCPITEKSDPASTCASVNAWIPPGEWYDFFTGFPYSGGEKGRIITLSREIGAYPVFCRSGAVIVTSSSAENDIVSLPDMLLVHIFAGSSGSFTLYEDEGDGFSYEDGKCVLTHFDFDWQGERATLRIRQEGDLSLIGSKRSYTVILHGVCKGAVLEKSSLGIVSSKWDDDANAFVIEGATHEEKDEILFEYSKLELYDREDIPERSFALLEGMQIGNMKKSEAQEIMASSLTLAQKAGSISALDIPKSCKDVLLEILTS